MKRNRRPLTSTVARLLLGLAAIAAVSSQTIAQQTVYYQQATSQPVYYYVQPATQYYQTGYSPGYYQYTYTPQYYQQAATQQYYQVPQYTQAPQYYQQPQQTQTTAAGAQVVPTAYTAPAAEAPATQPEAAPAVAYGDPYGFVSWLNSTRASYGLGPVSHDQNLSNWAAMNNNSQMAYGLGHFVMGPARRQNSAMGAGFPGAMWMGSPAHRAALLDPTITWIGIAAAGAYWTFNAN